MPRVLLLGSPPFAEPIRQRLASLGWLVGVLTVPPRPRGRGLRLRPDPAWQPDGERTFAVDRPTPEAVAPILAALRPDTVVLAAYGRIIPRGTLERLPVHRVNVHPSLLPRWRGPAPIPRTLLAGDAETGVTLHALVPAVDAGPIVARARYRVELDATTGSLGLALAQLGADLLATALPDYTAGRIIPQHQPVEGATHAPKVTIGEATLNPKLPAAVLERAVRAFDPWPHARIELAGTPLLIHRAAVAEATGAAGTVTASPRGPLLVTGSGGLILTRVQRPGRPVVDGTAFLRGFRGPLPAVVTSLAETSALR